MRAKPRNKESISCGTGATRRVYMPNTLYDKLIQNSAEKDVSFSKLICQRLEVFDKIKFLMGETKTK